MKPTRIGGYVCNICGNEETTFSQIKAHVEDERFSTPIRSAPVLRTAICEKSSQAYWLEWTCGNANTANDPPN